MVIGVFFQGMPLAEEKELPELVQQHLRGELLPGPRQLGRRALDKGLGPLQPAATAVSFLQSQEQAEVIQPAGLSNAEGVEERPQVRSRPRLEILKR